MQRIFALRRGNYFVFFPSFEFLERVANCFGRRQASHYCKQEQMKAPHVEAILEQLREKGSPPLSLPCREGRLSEGMDYAGDMVIGAFVIGPPLPNFDLEREQMREYYQRQYGRRFRVCLYIPAMAKAIQAAGRVIRSESDRGIIVLMDSRFLEWIQPVHAGRLVRVTCKRTGFGQHLEGGH